MELWHFSACVFSILMMFRFLEVLDSQKAHVTFTRTKNVGAHDTERMASREIKSRMNILFNPSLVLMVNGLWHMSQGSWLMAKITRPGALSEPWGMSHEPYTINNRLIKRMINRHSCRMG